MAAPVTGNLTTALAHSDPHLTVTVTKTELNSPNSAQDCLTSDQSVKTSDSQPPDPDVASLAQSDDQIEHPPPISFVLSDPSGPCLSWQKEKSPTKGFNTPVPSSPAMVRAVEVQYSLGTEFPSCIKLMSKSQVSSGFWLGLPLQFCKTFLPKQDATLVLEDENGEQCEVKYIAYKFGLSAGWKNFAMRHKLIEEDVLVFQLVESTKFKVYILKANDSREACHALSLLAAEADTEQTTPVTPSPKRKRNKHPASLSLTAKKHKNSVPSSRSILSSGQHIEQSRNESKECGLEVLECSRPSKPCTLFQEVKSFQDFHIMVKGHCIDRELPSDVRSVYYKLCLYEKEFLHDGLPESLYYKLVVGMIGETVRIANEIKNCKLTTTREEFEAWDNSLKSFELLGMKLGFLRDKIHRLATLVFESEGALDIKRYAKAKKEHKRAEDEIKKVAAKLKELKETAKKFDGIVDCLKPKVEKYEREFQEEIDSLP